MKKNIMLSLVLLLILTACSLNEPVDNTQSVQEIAKNFIISFTNKEFGKMVTDYSFSDKMKTALNETVLDQIHSQLIIQFGEFKEVTDTIIDKKNGTHIVTIVCKFENESLNLLVSFDSSKRISSFTYNKSVVEVPKEDYIFFGDQEYQLRGKLTLPDGDGPYPALIIIHGSGAADMDLTVGESTPYKDIAEYLQKQGIAVLRYDKRTFTHAQKMAQENDMTVYNEYIDDSTYAFEYLKNQVKIDNNNIFIAAHSQSGYLIPRIAEENPDAKGFIVLAGMSRNVEDVIIEQVEYLNNLDGIVTTEEQQVLDSYVKAREMFKDLDSLPEDSRLLGAPKSYWIDLRDYQPLEQIKDIKRPILFLQGERDYQVTMTDFNNWKEATDGLSNFSFKSYSKLNHLFIAGEGKPNPQEYVIGDKVSEEMLSDLAQFMIANK